MQKLTNSSQTRLFEWFENIVNDFYEEKMIKEHPSFDDIKTRFHDDLHDRLFNLLINNGVVHIIKP